MINKLNVNKIKDMLVRVLMGVISFPLTPLNNYFINRYSNEKCKHPPIFIVGAPRTGSTILYQAITNQSKALYFDNLSARLCKVTFIGFWLSEKLYKGRAHNNFSSKYGDTFGMHSPNECGEYWYRFLPRNQHFIDHDELDSFDIRQIKKEITAISNFFNKPILFKNLNAGQRLRLIKEIFPDAKFIYIKRDPLYTAQSILTSKRKQGIPDDTFWSIRPKNFKELSLLSWPNQISKQIYFLEKQITKDLSLFDEKNISEVNYIDLDSDMINKIINKLELKCKSEFDEVDLSISEKNILNKSDFELLSKAIEGLEWQKKYD